MTLKFNNEAIKRHRSKFKKGKSGKIKKDFKVNLIRLLDIKTNLASMIPEFHSPRVQLKKNGRMQEQIINTAQMQIEIKTNIQFPK